MPQTKWQIENAERWKAYKAEWRSKNRDKTTASNKVWLAANKDRKAATCKKWHDDNYDSAAAVARARSWKLANPDKRRAIVNNSNAIRKQLLGGQQISKCYSKQIVETYRNCPKGHQVDHMVPLRGKLVCGLHVPWNLQYLPDKDNAVKSNKLLEEMT